MPEESHLVVDGERITGRVTSIAWSPTLGHADGHGVQRAPDRAEPGTPFTIKAQGGRFVEAEVVATPFVDPANERQNA
ncbi:MAG: glycine cleavage T C-terminal barrel domain-containing protein [Halofilum sp. (in: g-proteobacteria)]|nr:glycine cleavage T C-terminal barrel domain-containing protein [Halofilum sp. (in: g-proteobacteria)]